MSTSRRLRSLVAAFVLVVATPSSSPAHAAPSAARPIAAASIRLVVEGSEVASFDQLVSLTSAIEGSAVRQCTVVLRRPATASLAIAAWHDAALRDDEGARRDVDVIMHAPDGKPAMRYAMSRALPSRLELASSDVSEVLLETVTLSCAHLERVAL
jgi:hypothetical protein